MKYLAYGTKCIIYAKLFLCSHYGTNIFINFVYKHYYLYNHYYYSSKKKTDFFQYKMTDLKLNNDNKNYIF